MIDLNIAPRSLAPASAWRHVAEIQSVLAGLALAFAREITDSAMPSAEEVAAALRAPVSLGSALADLAAALEIEPPACVALAIG